MRFLVTKLKDVPIVFKNERSLKYLSKYKYSTFGNYINLKDKQMMKLMDPYTLQLFAQSSVN
jgi:hypothetical protein